MKHVEELIADLRVDAKTADENGVLSVAEAIIDIADEIEQALAADCAELEGLADEAHQLHKAAVTMRSVTHSPDAHLNALYTDKHRGMAAAYLHIEARLRTLLGKDGSDEA